MAKNLTLSVDENLLREARKIAAEQETTVNAIVRAHLADLVARRRRTGEALARMREISEAAGMEVGVRVSRDELHER